MQEDLEKRVKILETQPRMIGGVYRHVSIGYSDKTTFFDGWVDEDLMPIIFGRDRESGYLPEDRATPLAKYQAKPIGAIEYAKATKEYSDRIIDLRFQNYFDGGIGQISALAALGQEFDVGHLTLYAYDEGLVIGQVYVRHCEGEGYIDDLYVHSRYRNKGIARKLVTLMEEAMRKEAIENLTLVIQDYDDRIGDLGDFWGNLGYSVIEGSVQKLHGFTIANLLKTLRPF